MSADRQLSDMTIGVNPMQALDNCLCWRSMFINQFAFLGFNLNLIVFMFGERAA